MAGKCLRHFLLLFTALDHIRKRNKMWAEKVASGSLKLCREGELTRLSVNFES